jgi:hypothetical protein
MPYANTEQQAIDSAKSPRGEERTDFSDLYKGIVQSQQADSKRQLMDIRDDKDASHSFLQSAENVLGAIGKGAWNEVTKHPLRVGASGGLGFVLGVGATFISRPVATAVGVVSLGVAGLELATHAPKWYQDAKITANPQGYSPFQIARAENSLQKLGAGTVDVSAGMLGGLGGAKFAKSESFAMIKDSLIRKPPPVVAPEFKMPELQLHRDDFSIKTTIAGNDRAWFRAEIPLKGSVHVTDLYRGDLPKGTGGKFLAESLLQHGELPTDLLVFRGVTNLPTMATYRAGTDPALSVLGKTGTEALQILGITPKSYWFNIRNGKLDLIITMAR